MPRPTLDNCLAEMPLIAILRGLPATDAVPVVQTLFDAGFRVAEVPLNRPGALDSIANLSSEFGKKMMIGAGTVLTKEDVANVASAGGNIIISPNFDADVAREAKDRGLYYCPGIQTPTEGFAALKLGADALKLFPAEAIAPKVVQAMRAVLPTDVTLVPVGSVGPHNMPDYWASGATGFGFGLNLYQPGKAIEDIRQDASAFADLMRSIMARGANV